MNVLAVGCHPDDIEIGCGGTLLKYAKRGDDVYICHVASGNMGHVSIDPGTLSKIRMEEAKKGGALLGANAVFSLGADDLQVDSGNATLVRRLTELIRQVNPDVIITHSPDDYMKDHIETSKLVFDASFSATVPHYAAGTATHTFVPIYYMDTLAGVGFQPEFYVDITETLEQKLEALNQHESQIKWMRDHDSIDFPEMIRTCAKFRGYQCSVPYAEGFRICKVYPRMTTCSMLP